jgi:phosphoserine phosphatase RsbX
VTPSIEHLTIPKQGEHVSGDAAYVRVGDPASLFAVVDALGHGPTAAGVAKLALAYFETAPIDRGVRRLVEGLHDALRGSRGAAAMVCLLKDGRMEGCGVGNVELRSLGSKVPAVLTPGILGASLNRLRTFEAALAPGDRLVVFSDGLSSRIDFGVCHGLPPREACQVLMDRYRRSHDDSTVLITDLGT